MSYGVIAKLPELIALRRHAGAKPPRNSGKIGLNGHHYSRIRGRGMDFAEVRNYQAGDEIRHMEWRITARTGKPHIKLYEEERERPVVIMVDFNPSMYFGTRTAFKSVIAARLASLIAWVVAKQGDRVGGLLFSANEHNEFLPRGREEGVLAILAALSRYTTKYDLAKDTNQPLSIALQRVRRVTRPGSILVIISDFYNLDFDSEEHLSRLRMHNEIFAYHILDPLEISPPPPQKYMITNGKNSFLLDTNLVKMQNAYSEFCQQRISQIKAILKTLQIRYNQVSSDQDLAELVRNTFPRLSYA